MMNRLRILLLTNKCPPDFDGGFELRAFQLAKALRERGHAVDVVTSRFRPTFKGERCDPPWVHRIFRYVPVSQAVGFARRLDRVRKHLESTTVAAENMPAMERYLAQHHDGLEGRDGWERPYDIAYCFGMLRISFGVVEPVQRRGIPILWHAGGTCMADHFFHWPKKIPGYGLAMRLLTRGWYAFEHRVRFQHVAYVSEFLRDREEERGHVPPHRYVISRGIDFPLRHDVERAREEPPMFFMACRLDPYKGVHHAVSAAALLYRRNPERAWRLEIAGESLDPGYRATLEAQIAREGLQDRVQFLGRLSRSEVSERMSRATAFLFTSIYGEPFSSTIIETLASGTPLIAADDGSILEVVEPGVTALVYPKNEPHALAAHMEAVLDDPARGQALARAGLRTIEQRYTLDRILDLTEQTFARVIADCRGPGHPNYEESPQVDRTPAFSRPA
jgi:glycosyltransferase involved in cell wall biosynthesis